MNINSAYKNGDKVIIKVNGERVIGIVVGWDSSLQCERVSHGGKTYSRKVYGLATSNLTGIDLLFDPNMPTMPSAAGDVIQDIEDAAPEFDINQRFAFIDQMIDILVKSENIFSMVLSGTGGLGKTTTVMNAIARHGMTEDEDYTVVKGFATPKSLYRILFENADKLVIFDDCDSVLEDQRAFNILKGALDDKPIRRISWRTEAVSNDDSLPPMFEFTGKIIFITNKKLGSFDSAILSRSLFVDVTMTVDEKIQRITTLADAIAPHADAAAKADVIALLIQVKHRAKELSLRTFRKVLEIRLASANSNWMAVARYMLLTSPCEE